jgi:hypothetical protein
MSEVEPNPETPADAPPIDPQAILQGMSIADLESDIEALMNDRMSELDEMLDGLEQLVQKIEGEMDQFEGLTDPPQ